jgi:hypothetical protein
MGTSIFDIANRFAGVSIGVAGIARDVVPLRNKRMMGNAVIPNHNVLTLTINTKENMGHSPWTADNPVVIRTCIAPASMTVKLGDVIETRKIRNTARGIADNGTDGTYVVTGISRPDDTQEGQTAVFDQNKRIPCAYLIAPRGYDWDAQVESDSNTAGTPESAESTADAAKTPITPADTANAANRVNRVQK